jgi:hypothetical protein
MKKSARLSLKRQNNVETHEEIPINDFLEHAGSSIVNEVMATTTLVEPITAPTQPAKRKAHHKLLKKKNHGKRGKVVPVYKPSRMLSITIFMTILKNILTLVAKEIAEIWILVNWPRIQRELSN